MKRRRRVPQSIDSKVIARVLGTGRGYVFTPNDFLDLGSRSAVYNALARGAKADRIRKLAQGLYDHPRIGADGKALLRQMATAGRKSGTVIQALR